MSPTATGRSMRNLIDRPMRCPGRQAHREAILLQSGANRRDRQPVPVGIGVARHDRRKYAGRLSHQADRRHVAREFVDVMRECQKRAGDELFVSPRRWPQARAAGSCCAGRGFGVGVPPYAARLIFTWGASPATAAISTRASRKEVRLCLASNRRRAAGSRQRAWQPQPGSFCAS